MTETEYKQPTNDIPREDTLLDRLGRINKLTEKIRSSQSDETSLERDDTQFTHEFTHMVNILMSKAKTETWRTEFEKQSDLYAQLDVINSIIILPDEKLADLGKNEMNVTTFVRRFLPKSEWPNYIPPINL